MRAADVMSRPVLTIRADDSVEQASALLIRNNITSAPVVDPAGDLVGVISEADLLMDRLTPQSADSRARQPPPGGRPAVAADVMSTNVVVMPPDADLADVAEAMLYNNVRSVPVVDDTGQLTGIVSRHDILRAVMRTDDVMQLEIQHRLDEYAGDRRWTVTVSGGAAAIVGEYADDVERRVIGVLARTVPGVSTVEFHASP